MTTPFSHPKNLTCTQSYFVLQPHSNMINCLNNTLYSCFPPVHHSCVVSLNIHFLLLVFRIIDISEESRPRVLYKVPQSGFVYFLLIWFRLTFWQEYLHRETETHLLTLNNLVWELLLCIPTLTALAPGCTERFPSLMSSNPQCPWKMTGQWYASPLLSICDAQRRWMAHSKSLRVRPQTHTTSSCTFWLKGNKHLLNVGVNLCVADAWALAAATTVHLYVERTNLLMALFVFFHVAIRIKMQWTLLWHP